MGYVIIFIIIVTVIIKVGSGDDCHHGGCTTKRGPKSPKPDIAPKPWPRNDKK